MIVVGVMCVVIGVVIGLVMMLMREGGRTTGDVASVGANVLSGVMSCVVWGVEEVNLGDVMLLVIVSVFVDLWMLFLMGKV